MSKLFVWSEGYKGYVKKKGVPSSAETIIRDSPNTSPGKWTLYISGHHSSPPSEEFKLPEELYFEISGTNIAFDYLDWNRKVKIVSAPMLQFLKEHGITKGYEIATIKNVINRSGKILEIKQQYYALRFYLFDDALMEFHPETKKNASGAREFKLYPDMESKSGVSKDIFVLQEFVYANSLIFTERIKDEIEKRKFIGPEIYPMNEFHIAYNGQ